MPAMQDACIGTEKLHLIVGIGKGNFWGFCVTIILRIIKKLLYTFMTMYVKISDSFKIGEWGTSA